eukprot:21009_1
MLKAKLSGSNTNQTLTNLSALQCIEDLYSCCKPKQSSLKKKSAIVERASLIYAQIGEARDACVIGKFVKLCMDYDHLHRFKLTWNDAYHIQVGEIVNHNEFPYHLLLKCCVKSGDRKKCMQLLEWIENACTRDGYTLSTHDSFITKLIAQCTTIDDVGRIDWLVTNNWIECGRNEYIQTALINAYGTHKRIADAERIFASIPDETVDVFCVGSMMKAYLNNAHYEEALHLYSKHSTLHDNICHCLALKACSKAHEYGAGKEIYSHIKSPNIQIKTAMIDLHAAAHDMDSAMDVFTACATSNEVNIVTVNAMMTGYINNALYEQALELYDKIHLFANCNLKKNEISHHLALRACSNSNDSRLFGKGRQIHSDIGNTTNCAPRLATALIEMYGSFGDMSRALDVYAAMSDENKCDLITLGILMTAYTKNAFYAECLETFDAFSSTRDGTIYNLAIKACSHLLHYEKGREIHAEIVQKQQMNDQIGNTLIAFYGHCGDIDAAQEMYGSLCRREDTVSLNAMMTAFVDNECYDEGMMLYDDEDCCVKDATSHCLAIKICCAQKNAEKGVMIHRNIKCAFSIELSNSLIDFYGNVLGDVDGAQRIFDSIDGGDRSMVTLGTMMNVFVHNGCNERALVLFDSIMNKNHQCYKIALKACANCLDLNKGRMIHRQIKDIANVKMKTALIDFYAHCAQMKEAQSVFDSILEYDVDIVAVNALMNGYCMNGMYDECCRIFERIMIAPETATFVIVLSACGKADCIELGQRIHCELKQEANKEILKHLYVQIALIHMYGQFSMIEECRAIFATNTDKEGEIAVWNAMLDALGRNGYADEAQNLFDEMGVVADRFTYAALMNAYSHSGKIQQIKDLAAVGGGDHDMSSLVDGLSRSGLLCEAAEVIQCCRQKQSKKHTLTAMYVSLLSGCKTHKNKLIAQYAFDKIKLMKSEEDDDDHVIAAATVLLANIYAEHHQFDVVNELRGASSVLSTNLF